MAMGLLLQLSLVLAIFAVQSECAQRTANKPETEKRMENLEPNNLPKLDVSFNSDEKNLEIEYKIKNETGSTIYLFNVLLDPDAADKMAPQKFYSCLRDDSTLVLAKMIPPVPSIATVEFREIPYVTKLEAGKEFGEKVTIPLPIDEFNPYFMKNQSSKTELRTSESVVFIVQFIREKEGLEVEETKIPNAYSVWHKDLFGNVETLSAKPRPLFVKVNRRLDTFERF